MAGSTFYGLMFIIIALAVTVMAASFSGQIQGELRDDQVTGDAGCNSTHKGNCGYDYNISLDAMDATSTMSSKFNLLATVAIAGIIISTLLAAFAFKRQ